MKTKVCCKCKKVKDIKSFYKDNSRFDGYYHTCKMCENKRNTLRRQSKHGVVRSMYKGQIYTSKKRGHNLPEYTFEELKSWVFNQQSWNKLYNDWLESNFDINKKPSIDRLNDSKGYSFDNIQLITWRDNLLKATDQQKTCNMIINHKKIVQLSLTGELIQKFDSIAMAGRVLNIDSSSIAKACKGILKTTKGFKWKYESDYIN